MCLRISGTRARNARRQRGRLTMPFRRKKIRPRLGGPAPGGWPARRLALLALALLCCAAGPGAWAQTGETATVSGRVGQAEGGPLHGIVVVLMSSDPAEGLRVLARATTDGDGRYTLSGVPPGRHRLLPRAAAYVVTDLPAAYPPGRQVIVSPGESVEDFDFTLVRGGVITGRVTDADGRPLVREPVSLAAVNPDGSPLLIPSDPYRHLTDDRGVYRIYGLSAGVYRVSAGADGDGGRPSPNGSFRRVYYPAAAREPEAGVVEVAPGAEVTGIDITLGRPRKTFRASGRVLGGAGGEPLRGVRLGYGLVGAEGSGVAWRGVTHSDARGEFRLDALAPGRYLVFALPEGASEWYGDSAPFEVRGEDVGGLEVRIRPGASLFGAVQIEGTADRVKLSRLLARVALSLSYERRDAAAPPDLHAPVRPAPDGSFRVVGLRPGRVRLATGWPPVKGLTLLRIEHEGADRSTGLDVGEGAQVTGVRAVFAYGDASLRGRVSVVNGVLPPQSRIVAFVMRAGGSGHFLGRPADVDARGHFAVGGLPAGEYDLVVQALRPGLPPLEVKQRVTLAEDAEMAVSLTLDLGAGTN